MVESKDIAIKARDRMPVIGASDTGKSTLLAQLVRDFNDTYIHGIEDVKKKGRCLVVDTKPRWRAMRSVTGGGVRRYYKDHVPGDTLDACYLNDLQDFDLAFNATFNNRVAISQRLDLGTRQQVAWQVRVIERFFDSLKHTQPSLIVIDEGMDFFGPTGNGRYSDIVQKCVRAGRERGLATLIGVQRPKTINIQCLTECNKLVLFRIDYGEDMKRLIELGYPCGVPHPTRPNNPKLIYPPDARAFPPDGNRVFRFFDAKRPYPSPLTLDLGR